MVSILGSAVIALTFPPLLSLVAILCAGVAWMLHWRLLAVTLVVGGLLWSLVWSIPICSEWLRDQVENLYPVVPENTLPKADAIVVLGGAWNYEWLDRPGVSADQLKYSRVAAGARAWLAGRAPVVILTGGRGEADMMARAITQLGVPSNALLLERDSLDTTGNAVNTAKIAEDYGFKRILLVTGASHMPRAMLSFQRAGLAATAVSVPSSYQPRPGIWRWVPSMRSLRRSTTALKEVVGLAALRVKWALS